MRSNRMLAVFGVGVVLGLAVGARFLLSARAKLRNFAQFDAYAGSNAALPPSNASRVIFFGDSITALWVENGGNFFPGKGYINRGISGQTTPQMLLRFRQDVLELHPAVVVVLAGVNDIAGFTGPETLGQIENNILSMAELARANGIRVVLCSVLPVTDSVLHHYQHPAEEIRALNEWLKTYASLQKLAYVDYYTAMVDEHGGMREGLSHDGLHPNAAGYAIMEPLAQAGVEQAFAGPAPPAMSR